MSLSNVDHEVPVGRPWSLGDRTAALVLLLLTPAILVLDYTGGRDVSLHLFYLLPTGLAAWSFGLRAGIAVGLAAAMYWAFVGFATRHPGASVAALAWDVVSTIGLFAFFAYVVSRHRAFLDGLLATARLDATSGALSKREFTRLLDAELRRARRYSRPLAYAVFDISSARSWPKVRDSHLAAIVRAVQMGVRDSDAVGRIGERRLGIVLVECPPAEALQVATRIREGLAESMRLDPPAPPIGIVTYGGSGIVAAAEVSQLALAQAQLAANAGGVSLTHLEPAAPEAIEPLPAADAS